MIDCLMDNHGIHGIGVRLMAGLLYLGDSRMRMHGPDSRIGADLDRRCFWPCRAAESVC